jgi:hypothetical protein
VTGQPFAVYLAHHGRFHTVVFDLDAKPGQDPRADADAVAAALTRSGIRFATARSGPADGRHIYATFPGGLDPDQVRAMGNAMREQFAPSMDMVPLTNPATGAIRPPTSPHREGGQVTLLTPLDEALEALREGNNQAAFDRLCHDLDAHAPDRHVTPAPRPRTASTDPYRPPHRDLPARYQHLLRDGDTGGLYRDRSAMAAAIGLALVNSGADREDFVRAALDPANIGLDHLRRHHEGYGVFRRRPTAVVSAAADRMWRGCVRYAMHHPAQRPVRTPTPDASTLVAAVLAAISTTPRRWGGQAGPADLSVLRAFLHQVLSSGQSVVSVSVRQLAELANCEASTAHRASGRLTRDGWLHLTAPSTANLAASYQVSVPATFTARDGDLAAVADGTLGLAPTHAADRIRLAVKIQRHDTCHPSGLGRTGAMVLIALTEEPGDEPDLAHRTGLSPRTIRSLLHQLRGVGLVRRTATHWYRNYLISLEHAALALKVTGATARRVEEHRHEQFLYAWYQADFTARRGWTTERGLYTTGRHTLRGNEARPVPSMAYPRRHARAAWANADRMLRAGWGPYPTSVHAAPPPPDRCRTPRNRRPRRES